MVRCAGSAYDFTQNIQARRYAVNTIVQQLDPIFKPRSIAVIGASENPGKWGYLMVQRPRLSGYPGSIYPVNKGKDSILGVPAYPSIMDVPGEVDLAIITLPADKVPGALRESVKKGVRGAVIITAGFAEVGNEGKLLQDEVVKIARDGGVRFVGPNCMGLWSAAGNLNLCFLTKPPEGKIAFVSQSGTYGSYISEKAAAQGYGLSKFISIGNQADITASEYLDYLVQDDDTSAIIFYIEGLRDGRKFFELAREVVRDKPIVVFKGGRTAIGARATLSHTASLAGSEVIFEAMCRQAGILVAEEALQTFEVAEALVRQPLPRGRKVAIMGSGGQCVVTSDACASLGLEVPELAEEDVRSIQKVMPPHAPPPRNPVDFAGSYRSIMEEAEVVEKFLSLDYIDGVITNVPVDWTSEIASAIDKTVPRSTNSRTLEEISYFASLPAKYGKPVVTVRWSRTFSADVENAIRNAGIPIYDTPEQCARAMHALMKYAEIRQY
jgi:acyl-CoA synthetase (NDP forming)